MEYQKVCKQGRDDVIVKVSLQSPIPTSFYITVANLCENNIGMRLCKLTFTITSSLPCLHTFWHSIPTFLMFFFKSCIDELQTPFKIKIALKQTLTLRLGVTLVLTVYVFVNLRQVMCLPPLSTHPLLSANFLAVSCYKCMRLTTSAYCISVCMKLLVRRGTSCRKGVVIVRSSNCYGTIVWVAKMLLSKAT